MEIKHYYTRFLSPLGKVQMHGTAHALHALLVEGQRHHIPLPENAVRDPSPLRFAREQVEEFLSGQRVSFSLRIEIRGTSFQMRVWRELLAIPYGQTFSYGEIAGRLGNPLASRAVGSALGRNPLLIVVPCHRVTGAGGALCGYSGGLAQKRFLLSLEKRTLLQPLAAGEPTPLPVAGF
jgi:methylated-DNA-[protein]-cysteine S-methyltransferase